MTREEIRDWCNSPENKEKDEWHVSSLKSTIATIKGARAKTPKNPNDFSARWDYPQAVEHLEIFLDAYEGGWNFDDETDRIEEMLERKKLLPNEDWLVERSRLRMLGHTEVEIQESLVKGKVTSIVNEWDLDHSDNK